MSTEPMAARFVECHDPFWPRVELSQLRDRLMLTEPVSELALDVAARCACIAAAEEFAQWRAALRRRGYKRLEEVCGHDHGRALRVCYLRFVEAAVMRNLGGVGALPRRSAVHA
ncbi:MULTISPECIES: head completion/stabilization protein [Pseudomonas]|uniref:head completion/stabilization protein n=1 Tax=Pseudomonas TaxID=286 RepID=UPI001E36C667|nr:MULTISPECIES: head completion/stabilization protein [Pseudomonas]MCE1118094.1 head completion/stabilization protein [Pseudomonas sp. NMI795_08]